LIFNLAETIEAEQSSCVLKPMTEMCKLTENKLSVYPTTQWTQIINVIQKGGDEESFGALEELFNRYRPAIHHFFARFNRSRAEDLTSAFFESRVLVPWNRRHGVLSPLYAAEDVRRLTRFAEALRQPKRPVEDYLCGIVSDDTRELLRNLGPNEKHLDDLRARLLTDLNTILQGPSIYETGRFAGVELSVESRNMLQREATGHWVTWLNRSLLGDAFPGQLTKGVGFLYLVERQEQRLFRTFLAHTMWWFLKDVTKAEVAQNAGGGQSAVSVEELAEAGFEIPDRSREEFGRQLDEEFARQVLALASASFRHSKQLEAHLYGRISQKQAAEELGLSENAFRQGYLRFRRRLADSLREEVMKLVGPNKAEVQAEMNYLMNLLTE
jgi:DNA-directed RNA polymerase specialized sigma24 family protein